MVRTLNAPGADETDSSIAENPEWQANPTATVDAQVNIGHWTSENKEVTIGLSKPAYAVFRLMDYPAWQVLVNDKAASARLHRDDGLLTVPLDAGQSIVTIRYAATRDVELGRALSLLALCIAIAVFAQTKRRRNLQLS